MARHWIDKDWLAEHYPTMTNINALLDDHEKTFGWRPSKTSVYLKASRMGIEKNPVANTTNKAERIIRWSKEPEMEAWMLENDHGTRIDVLSDMFRERFGFGISRAQINLFRASHGTQKTRGYGGRKPVPVGTERESKDGYIVRKVRERATVAMSKDNWKLKHVWVYEQAHGSVPEGHMVFFADGDKRNFDPDNLVAVPQKLAALLNSPGMPKWHDKETLEACVAYAQLKCKIVEVQAAKPRKCAVCGKMFVPDKRTQGKNVNAKTCRACLDAGHKAGGNYRAQKYDHDEIRRLAATGMKRCDIARRLGCSAAIVSDILNERHGYERTTDDRYGD